MNTIKDHLAKMANVYANCKTYQDSGRMKAIINPGSDRELVSLIEFKTFFQRPYLFRFEWTETELKRAKSKKNYILCDGENTHSWHSWMGGYAEESFDEEFDDGELEDLSIEEELSFLVAGATGISNSLAHICSSMLMPFIGGNLICDAMYTVCDEDGDNVRLTMSSPTKSGEDISKLWISKSKKTIFRIEEKKWIHPSEDDLDFPEYFDEELKRARKERLATAEPFLTHDEIFYESVILDQPIAAIEFDSDNFLPELFE